jgi:hypothetical protein
MKVANSSMDARGFGACVIVAGSGTLAHGDKMQNFCRQSVANAGNRPDGTAIHIAMKH